MAHLWLAGMMGTGKTTVGALVAEHTERPLLDTDVIVMESTGCTINDLFAQSEWLFRAHERSALVVASGHRDAVIATGGGAVLDPANRVLMAATGSVVVLTATTATIVDRIRSDADERPLATDPDEIGSIQRDRSPLYAAVADHTIDTTNRDPEAVAREMITCVGM